MNTNPGSAAAGRRYFAQALTRWLPSRGSLLLALMLLIVILVVGQRAGAFRPAAPQAASNAAIPYQGRLADENGVPLNGTFAITFRLYDLANGGGPLWSETWSGDNAVAVTSGLFNVLLGSQIPFPASLFAENSSLWLGVSVQGDSEMAPRIQLGSAAFAMQAGGVKLIDVASNAQTAILPHHIDKSVAAYGATDLLSVTVDAPYPTMLRVSYNSLVWITGSTGRTVLSVRVDGAPNTDGDGTCHLVAAPPVGVGYASGSINLSGTCYRLVSSGTHVVTLVLAAWDAGVAHGQYSALNVEALKHP